MRKQNQFHILRSLSVSEPRTDAFTLVELMVAVGLLALMMGLAGTIFALTLKSSGEANALIEVKQSIRALEYTMREDLRNVDPRESMLIIQGNIIRAYRTQDDMEFDDDNDPLTGYPIVRDPEREVIGPSGVLFPEMPRADMLMFFTNRIGESYVDHRVKGRKQQVVYGHAEVGKLAESGAWVDGVPPRDFTIGGKEIYAYVTSQIDPTAAFDPESLPSTTAVPTYPIPARQWHLARRGVLIVDRDFPSDYYPVTDLNDTDETGDDDDPRYPAATLPKKYWIIDGRRDFVINDNYGGFSFGYDVAFNLFDSFAPVIPNDAHADVDAVQNNPSNPQGLKIPWFARSQMDLQPSPRLADRLGHYMLPNCSSFKVEWQLPTGAAGSPEDLMACERERGDLVWVDPADIGKVRSEIKSWVTSVGDANLALRMAPLLTTLDPKPNPVPNPKSRFDRSTVGSNHIFYSQIQHSNGVNIRDPFFPTALRITIDVYDAAGRLERPIRHVMVLPIGEE